MQNKAIIHPDEGVVSHWSIQPKTATLMISPCRSGSTVMLRVFGYAGAAAYFQPIKNALRWGYLGAHRPWQPPNDGGPVFIKETFGPFHPFEAAFDPLAELINAGLAPDRLRLAVLLRDPGMVWASWRTVWPQTASINLLAQTYRACLSCVATARRLGVSVARLNYEASVRDPAQTLGPLFGAMGLGQAADALRDWPTRPAFGAAGSGVFLPDEPADYITQGAHDPVIQAAGFGKLPPRGTPPPAELDRLGRSDIPQSHAALARLPTVFPA